MEKYIEKINKTGKIGYAISRICTVMVTIAAVCCVVAAVLLAMIPRDGVMITTGHNIKIEMDMTNSILPNLVAIDEDDNGHFEMNSIEYDYFTVENQMFRQIATGTSTPYAYSLRDIMWICICGTAICAALIIAFKKVTALFDEFRKCNTPFTAEISDKLSKLVYSFIPVVILSWITQAVTERVFTGKWDISIGIDLTVVLMVLVVIMLSEVFRYGAMLQQESDETL